MKKRLFFLLAMLLTLGSQSRAQDCSFIAYHTGYPVTWYASFPLASGSNTFSKIAYYLNPVAAGDLMTLRLQFYNNNLSPALGHQGNLLVSVYSDNPADPGTPLSVVAGPMSVSTNAFATVYGTWDTVDLSPLAYSFSTGVPFHVVWEFVPAITGHKLAPLGVNGLGYAAGCQMYNSTAVPPAWGWWFSSRGDLLEEVELCYSSTPPGNLVLGNYFVDMGRLEVNQSRSDSFYATNTGGMNTTITGLATTNPATFSASLAGGLPQVLAPGDSALVTFTYTPGSTAVFRDTTSVNLSWTSNSLPVAVESFFTIAGSSEGQLTNDWTGSPEELDWFLSASGDTSITGSTWQLYSGGLNRHGYLAGHIYTAVGDTASSELYTFLDNSNLDDISWRFAYTQNYPTDTQDHALLVYGVEGGLLTYLYGYDITSFQQQSPTWAHLTASLDSLPDSLACSFYYGGSYADSWFIDDVDFTRSCSAIDIAVDGPIGGNVEISWAAFPGETVKILHSASAYDFSAATVVATEPSELGLALVPVAGTAGYFRAVRDCVPVPATVGLRRLDRHPAGVTTRRVEDLMPVVQPETRGGSAPMLLDGRLMPVEQKGLPLR